MYMFDIIKYLLTIILCYIMESFTTKMKKIKYLSAAILTAFFKNNTLKTRYLKKLYNVLLHIH